MRTQVINRTPFYYANYLGKVPAEDSEGFYTGEDVIQYSEPVLYSLANISPATGMSNTEQFGNLDNYDKVIVTSDLTCPVDENSVLWIDEPDTTQPYNYIVKRVSKSKNGVSIAVAKVQVMNNDG